MSDLFGNHIVGFHTRRLKCFIAADATRAGTGDLRVKVLHNGMEVRSHIYMESNGLYKVDFTPEGSGSYNVNVYFNDEEVRGLTHFVIKFAFE